MRSQTSPELIQIQENYQSSLSIEKCKPFLKWAGGKKWLVDSHPEFFPKNFNKFFEPFLGGGAAFFHLAPTNALISDTNNELIDTYLAIKEFPGDVFSHLFYHQKKHCKKYYYETRASNPKSLTLKAARFIYLNRTCFNGLYRVNFKGKFNVPIGTKNSVILDEDDFWLVSEVLKSAKIVNCDFETSINKAKKGDLIFADPPYTIKHNNNGFIQYNEKLFSWEDQVRLAYSLAKARACGVQIIATNANHASIRKLYRDLNFKIKPIFRQSCIAGTSSDRGMFDELVITNT